MARIPIPLPQLGEAVAEATVHSWLVAAGDTVARDQVIAEVETEKAVLEINAPRAGTIVELSVAEGDHCVVGDPVAVIDDGQAGDALVLEPEGSVRPTPPIRMGGNEVPALAASGGDRFLSPRVRALLSENGIDADDLYLVSGSGAGGRVAAGDVERLLEQLKRYEPQDTPAIRRSIADGMGRSWSRPLATVAADAKLEALMGHRRSIEGRPSVSVYALRALARSLREMPQAACLFIGGKLRQSPHVTLALAVDVGEGVLTPAVSDPEHGDLADLTKRVDALMRAARERRLTPSAFTGGIATITNFGSLGIKWATPIPPVDQSCILGLGAVRRVPDWNARTQSWDPVRECDVTLTFDHRIIDGAGAARLLHRVVHFLQHPDEC